MLCASGSGALQLVLFFTEGLPLAPRKLLERHSMTASRLRPRRGSGQGPGTSPLHAARTALPDPDIRALVTAGRALLTSDDLRRVRGLMFGEARDRAVFLALTLLEPRLRGRISNMSAELKRGGLTPDILDRLRLLGEAQNGLNRSEVAAALDHLVTPFAGISAFDGDLVLELLPHGIFPSDLTSERGEVVETDPHPLDFLNQIPACLAQAEAAYPAARVLA